MKVTRCLKNCLYIQETNKIWFEIYIKYGPHQTNLRQNWIYIVTYQVSLNTILYFYADKNFFPLSVQKICSHQNIRNQTVFSENPQMVICKALICLQSSDCRCLKRYNTLTFTASWPDTWGTKMKMIDLSFLCCKISCKILQVTTV